MAGHLRILAALRIVMGALGLGAGVLALLFFGGLAGLVGITDQSGGARIAVPILGGIGGLAFLLATVLALPSLIAGIGLLRLRPWSRILTIVLSVIDLFQVPIGTALGFYGLWILLSAEAEALFRQRPDTHAGGLSS